MEGLDCEKRASFQFMKWQLVLLCRQQAIPDAEKLKTAARSDGEGDMDDDDDAGGGAGWLTDRSTGSEDREMVGHVCQRVSSGGEEPSPHRPRVDIGAVPETSPTEKAAEGSATGSWSRTATATANATETTTVTGAVLTSTVTGTGASTGGTAAGGGEFVGSFGSGGVFSNDLGQLGDDTGQRAAFGGGTAGKTVFESVMRRIDG